jgi:hypothetical protein
LQPGLRARSTEEVAWHAPDGPLSMEGLSRVDTCTAVVMEAKRLVPLVPLAFGRARRTFASGGYEVSASSIVAGPYSAVSTTDHSSPIDGEPGSALFWSEATEKSP